LKREQRRLAAIFALDMVGYSRLVEIDEVGTLNRLKSVLDGVVAVEIKNHNGRIFKTTGDGVLVEFSSAVDAVECATGIQKLIREQPADEGQKPIQFRIGINLGDIVVAGDDVLGDGVNLASRIESVAEPGNILVSASTYDQVKGKLDLEFDDQGEHQLKNIDRPVHIYGVKMHSSVDTSTRLGAIVDSGSRPVVAVLPFENMSAAMDDDYFADGLTEDIITALSRFRELLVIARNSTFRFKNQAIDIPTVGRELNASYVLEGSVRRAANRVRITAQLIRVSDGTHIWADRYDRSLEDIFDVQDEVTQTIAATLGVRLQDAAREIALGKNHADLNAYDCVLRSRRYTQTLDSHEHARSRALLEKAIALDPGYSVAFAMLANIYLAEYRFDVNPLPDPIKRSFVMAEKAVELDPQNAYARCWLAIIHFFRKENDGFRKEAQRALALNPNDPEILAETGHYYAFLGEFERGVELTRRAIILNPLHAGWYHFSFARKNLSEGDYSAALADIRKVNLPGFYWTWLLKTSAFGHLGELESATDSLNHLESLMPGFSAKNELNKWNTHPDDFEQIMKGLELAGYTEN